MMMKTSSSNDDTINYWEIRREKILYLYCVLPYVVLFFWWVVWVHAPVRWNFFLGGGWGVWTMFSVLKTTATRARLSTLAPTQPWISPALSLCAVRAWVGTRDLYRFCVDEEETSASFSSSTHSYLMLDNHHLHQFVGLFFFPLGVVLLFFFAAQPVQSLLSFRLEWLLAIF